MTNVWKLLSFTSPARAIKSMRIHLLLHFSMTAALPDQSYWRYHYPACPMEWADFVLVNIPCPSLNSHDDHHQSLCILSTIISRPDSSTVVACNIAYTEKYNGICMRNLSHTLQVDTLAQAAFLQTTQHRGI